MLFEILTRTNIVAQQSNEKIGPPIRTYHPAAVSLSLINITPPPIDPSIPTINVKYAKNDSILSAEWLPMFNCGFGEVDLFVSEDEPIRASVISSIILSVF